VTERTSAPASRAADREAGAGDSRPEGAAVSPLKLVVTLSPSPAGRTRAVLGVGREGCDPVFRTIEDADLGAALDAVPDLIAAAEAAWRAQPRHPAARPATPRPTAPRPRPADPPTLAVGPAPPPAPAPAPPAATTGQLALFD
jgi:hypothetical protein